MYLVVPFLVEIARHRLSIISSACLHFPTIAVLSVTMNFGGYPDDGGGCIWIGAEHLFNWVHVRVGTFRTPRGK